MNISTDLWEKYSPIVFFYQDEETYPISIEKFLESAKIVENETWKLVDIVSDTIDFQDYRDNVCITSSNQYIFDDLSTFTKFESAPVYTHIVKKFTNPLSPEPTYLQLQYWFFYPYNGWVSRCFKNTHRHEGDWEHISVEIDAITHEITRVFFSKHGSRESQWYSLDELSFTDTHVHVYSARNSHACYPTPGQHKRGPVLFGKHIPILGFGFLDDFTGSSKGSSNKIWRTWEQIVNLDVNPPDWIQFKGYWGSGLWKGSDKRGPRSARWQQSWYGD